MPQPVLTATGLNDLTATTIRWLGKPKFTEIATNLQRHTAMKNLVRQNRMEIISGFGLQWDVMVDHAASAANVGLAAVDNVGLKDTMVQATADWRFTSAYYTTIGQEIDMNREPARIVDLIRQRRISSLISLAELMEGNFWGPPVASTDSVTPWGVYTWIVKNNTDGFNGGAPSGFTTIGLNPTTYPNWQNYTNQYTNVTPDDLIRKWSKAATFTDFEPPVEGIPTFNTGDIYGFFMNYGVYGPLQEILRSQNDNLGTDIAMYDGKVMFHRVPCVWVPKLEPDTTNPVFGINWGSFKTFVLQNWWMREIHVPVYPGQHTMSAHFIDLAYQWITTNRRVHFVLATGTSNPS